MCMCRVRAGILREFDKNTQKCTVDFGLEVGEDVMVSKLGRVILS